MAALAFVEGAVLTSSDGVIMNQVQEIEHDEEFRLEQKRQQLREKMNQSSYKSLADQLAENKEKHDEEWRAANNPFRAPPGLDEEDFQFLEAEDAARRDKQLRAKEFEEEDTKKFQEELQMQRMSNIVKAPELDAVKKNFAIHSLSEIVNAPKPKEETPLPPVLRISKKTDKDKKKKGKKRKTTSEKSPTGKQAKNDGDTVGVVLVGGYGSGSDEE